MAAGATPASLLMASMELILKSDIFETVGVRVIRFEHVRSRHDGGGNNHECYEYVQCSSRQNIGRFLFNNNFNTFGFKIETGRVATHHRRLRGPLGSRAWSERHLLSPDKKNARS